MTRRVAASILLFLAPLAPSHVSSQGAQARFSATATGVVIDGTTDRPIEHAEVQVIGTDGASAVTGPDGRFTLVGLERGDFFVAADKEGYVQLKSSHLTVTGPGLVAGLRVALFRMPSLSGRVVDTLGRPVKNVEVTLIEETWQSGHHVPDAGEIVQSGDDGEFRFDKLFPDAYALTVSRGLPRTADTPPGRDDRVVAPAYSNGADDLPGAILPSLRWSEDRRLPDWVVDTVSTGTVKGLVRGVRSSESLTVVLRSDAYPRIAQVQFPVESDGRFTGSLVPGHYHARIVASESGDNHPSGIFGEATIDVRADIAQSLVVDAQYGGDVSGRVLAPMSGEPPRVTVLLNAYDARSNTRQRQSAVDVAGYFRFASVPPGKYFVTAFAQPPWNFVDAEWNGRTVADQPLVVPPAGVHDVEILFNQLVSSLSGRIVGLPETDLTVAVFPTDRALWTDFPQSGFVEADGCRFEERFVNRARQYAFGNLPAGMYYVVAYANLAHGQIVDIDDWKAPANLDLLATVATTVVVNGATTAPPLKPVDFKAVRPAATAWRQSPAVRR